MTLTLGLAVYFVIWWVVLFAVLPFGVKTQGESGHVVPGTVESAPVHHHLPRTFAITTVAAAVVFAIVLAIIRFKLISLHEVGVPGG